MTAMTRVWLMAVLVSVGCAACATTQVLSSRSACEQGRTSGCGPWGDELLQQGDIAGADRAFGLGCNAGDTKACLALGRLRMEGGDLNGAEPPLTKVYLGDDEEGALALADLREARGGERDLESAARLRREAPALDKPDFEFVFAYRVDAANGLGNDISLNIQPLAFFERRLTFGGNVAFARSGASELNGFIGYQHFMSSWLLSYARLMVGGALDAIPGQGPNVGGELGVKLCLGSLGHLNIAVGSSRASPAYMSMGLGLNGILVLLAALH
jgi:hypothetical protein